MLGQNPASKDFLTPEEASEVESALLSSREKFTTRVAIYSLRVLKRIASEQGKAIANISQNQIIDWVNQDESVQATTIPGLEADDSFKFFFSKLVVSSLRPLHKISQESGTPFEELSVTQVVQWFEKEAKIRIEQESQ